jgi:hypothetical protein
MITNTRFASRVFLLAGIYGILVLSPQYLVESGVGMAPPEPIRNPEHFYGFVGLALVWQFVFLLISRNVARYRPLMLIAVLEKLAFGLPVLLLYMRGRVTAAVLSFGLIDLVLGVLFVAAYFASRPEPETEPEPMPLPVPVESPVQKG